MVLEALQKAPLLVKLEPTTARVACCFPSFADIRGHEFALNMLAEYTSSIFIQSEGCDCNTGTGGASYIAPEHDFVDGSDFSQLTSVTFLEEEEALAATAVGHLSRESFRGIVELRF